MKLSVAIAGENALPSAFVVFRGFRESIEKAARLGYQGVELALKSHTEIHLTQLRKWLSDAQIEVSAVSTGQVFADLGLSFTDEREAIRDKAVEVFRGLVDIAGEFGGRINIGRVRGGIAPEQTPSQAKALFCDTINRICEHTTNNGVRIMIEPVNRYEINFINNLDEAAALISETCPTLRLMPDVFHMNIEDAGIPENLKKHIHLIEYIHLADSNRMAPGWGHLDFEAILAALRDAGFDGWASVEITPHPDPDTAAAQAAATLLPLIQKYSEKESRPS